MRQSMLYPRWTEPGFHHCHSLVDVHSFSCSTRRRLVKNLEVAINKNTYCCYSFTTKLDILTPICSSTLKKHERISETRLTFLDPLNPRHIKMEPYKEKIEDVQLFPKYGLQLLSKRHVCSIINPEINKC